MYFLVVVHMSSLASSSSRASRLEVVMEYTIHLNFFQEFLVLRFVPYGPSLRWMFSDAALSQKILTVPCAAGNMNFPLFGVNTSFALSLLVWSSDATISSKCSMSATKISLFEFRSACKTYPRNVLGKTLGPNGCCFDRSWKGNIRPLLQTR